jgi:hypothetical protein
MLLPGSSTASLRRSIGLPLSYFSAVDTSTPPAGSGPLPVRPPLPDVRQSSGRPCDNSISGPDRPSGLPPQARPLRPPSPLSASYGEPPPIRRPKRGSASVQLALEPVPQPRRAAAHRDWPAPPPPSRPGTCSPVLRFGAKPSYVYGSASFGPK